MKTISLTFFFAICLLLIHQTNTFAATLQDQVNILVSHADDFSRKKGNHALAIKYINQAIKMQPQRLELYYQRAFIFGRAGQYQYAIRDFNRFVKSESFSHAVRFRADCFMAIGQTDRAAKDYMSFLKQYPKDGKVWSYLVESLALMGKKAEALEAANRGISTGSHWTKRLVSLQKQILTGEIIIPHKPLSN